MRRMRKGIWVSDVDDGRLAQAIKTARRQARLTQREVARRSGVAASQISRIESGEIKQPNWWTVDAIAQALGRPDAPLNFLAGNAIPEEIPHVFQGHEGLEHIPGLGKRDQHGEATEADFERLRS